VVRPIGLIARCYFLWLIVATLSLRWTDMYSLITFHPRTPRFIRALHAASLFIFYTSIVYAPFYWYRLRAANVILPSILKEVLYPRCTVISAHDQMQVTILVPVTNLNFLFELFDGTNGDSVAQFNIELSEY